MNSLYSVVEDYRRLLDQMNVQVGDERVSLRCVRRHRAKPRGYMPDGRRGVSLFPTRTYTCFKIDPSLRVRGGGGDSGHGNARRPSMLLARRYERFVRATSDRN